MKLNINTPRGQKSLEYEKEVTTFFERANEGLQWIDTPKGMPAAVDGVWIRYGELKSVAEIKCRDMSEDTFFGRYKAEWLLSVDKLEKGRLAAKLLGVPFFGYLALIQSGIVLYKSLYDGEGRPTAEWTEKRTGTPKNINGGYVERLNAFIPMEDAWQMTYRVSKSVENYGLIPSNS